MLDIQVRIEDLTKTYGDEVAVDGLSTEIKAGELKSLLGPSGCGKTTTLRCVAGLEQPDSGRIYIDGELVSAPEEDVHVSPENRGIGMVFQSYAIWPHMTVEENVRYPLDVQKIGDKSERAECTRDILERVGLDEYATNLATNLSGGQQQRVAIARALILEPEVLLFDEPLSNLDAKLRRDMRLEIKDLYQDLGTTVLYVTHSQDEAMFLSDEIAVMLDGHIVEEGDPVELHTNSQKFFTMNFMGQCNTCRGTITAANGKSIDVETGVGDFHLETPRDGADIGSEVFVCFRPKSCRLVADGDVSTATETVFEGTVSMMAATRDFTEYQIDVGGSILLVRLLEPMQLEIGDSVALAIDQADVKVFNRDEGDSIIADNQATTLEQAMPESFSD